MHNNSSIKITDAFKKVLQADCLEGFVGLKDPKYTPKMLEAVKGIRDGLNIFLKEVVEKWKTVDEYCIDVNTIVDKFIEAKIGNLNNFSPELYETIRHILYEYFGLLKEATHPGWLPTKVKSAKDLETGLERFIEERGRLQCIVDALPDLIKELRNLPAVEQEYVVRMILDNIKYGIKHVGYKPELLRIVERKWKNLKWKLAGKETVSVNKTKKVVIQDAIKKARVESQTEKILIYSLSGIEQVIEEQLIEEERNRESPYSTKENGKVKQSSLHKTPYICKTCGKEMLSLIEVVEYWNDIYCNKCGPK